MLTLPNQPRTLSDYHTFLGRKKWMYWVRMTFNGIPNAWYQVFRILMSDIGWVGKGKGRGWGRAL